MKKTVPILLLCLPIICEAQTITINSTYDLGRLKNANYSTGDELTYTHDNAGSRETKESVPGKATLSSPTGTINEETPTYQWNAVNSSTWYYLWINDANGLFFKKWYSDVCHDGTCQVKPTKRLVNGHYTWWIQTWNERGYGPWSAAMAFTVSGVASPPSTATLLSPKGTITENNPTYTWNPVDSSVWYYLWINDANGLFFKKWYSDVCHDGTCQVKPTKRLVNGYYTWWIQTWNERGYGPWSKGMSFGVAAPPSIAELVKPTGIIVDNTPVYTWKAVDTASWYYLWINDSSNKLRFKKWYRASDVCHENICQIEPAETLSHGKYAWWIQTWNVAGYGAWSLPKTFELASYGVQDGTIYHNQKPVHLYGVNWFGFETDDHAPHGLWARGYKSMITQIKTLEFNAVRLPFCPKSLKNGVATRTINFSIAENAELQGLTSIEVMDKIVEALNAQEIYILLDHHNPDCKKISELWDTEDYSEEQWINDLVFVVERYKDIHYFLGIDLKNEPHGAATWGTGNIETDWNLAAERASQAILTVNPNILIFVEGIETNPDCSSHPPYFWGGNLGPQQCAPLNIPPEKLVFSPHVYGPDVANQPYFNDSNFPENMPEIWNAHFGYLTGLAIGEFGGQYGETCSVDSHADPRGISWENAMIDYLIDKPICNFFYWSINANSGDTCGLLQDDWITIREEKYDNLHRLMTACGAL